MIAWSKRRFYCEGGRSLKRNMAEAAVVSALIDKLTSMVVDKLSQEVSLIVHFRKDFQLFCDKLKCIKNFLEDAGERRNSTTVSDWLDSLEDFVTDAEYLMEQYGERDRISGKLFFRLRMGHKIRKLKERLENIQRINIENLRLLASVLHVDAHFQPLQDARNYFEDKRERSSDLIRESETVGMEHDISVLIKWASQEDGPRVIAVVGMGGQGKTLLLQHIFKREEVHGRFDCHVWLAVSQKFVVIELLRDVVEQLEGNDNNLTALRAVDLRKKIDKYLENRSCLFAVDDVWDRDAWDRIGLQSRNVDKVVVTTRDQKVAHHMRAQIFRKDSLSEENSWKLFCIHAFPDDAQHSCPQELEKIAHDIVNKCGRAPLAIKAIGAHLATLPRSIPNDWERTSDHLNEADGINDRVMPSLKLSYEALPPHLKPCFLYCSVFPKNTEIESEYLVHAWIAQGFVSAQLKDSYDVGRSYLEELIYRCLIEISKVGGNGRVKSCKIHDLLHDLAVSEQTKCLVKPGGQLEGIPAGECHGLRRISLMKNEISRIEEGIQCPRLRSLLLSDNMSLSSISANFFDNMRYLCVLDLSGTAITSLPDSVGSLKLLKYLNLSCTKIKKLPESLSGLRQLQFLDVSNSDVERLHSGIDKHKYMLHLNIKGSLVEECPAGISRLVNLQTLRGVRITLGNAASANALQLTDLRGLTLLQHVDLTFTYLSESGGLEGGELEGTFRDMTEMRTLSLYNRGVFGWARHLPSDMEAMKRLEIIYLNCYVVPKWIFQLQNLMELELKGPPGSSSADFTGLEKIPNLKKLSLIWNENEELVELPKEFGEAGAFPKLEELLIHSFAHLNSIPSFHEDAMPKLNCLRFTGCRRELENMPEGLTGLKKLKEVEVELVVGRDGEENFVYDKAHCWESFKERQIKVKVETYGGRRLV